MELGSWLGYIIFQMVAFFPFSYFQQINRDDNIMQAWRGGGDLVLAVGAIKRMDGMVWLRLLDEMDVMRGVVS